MSNNNLIIRTEVKDRDVQVRGCGYPPARLKAIRKGLITLHNFERMAVNIYRSQITKQPAKENIQLISAMLNEMTHVQDFQMKLYEFGFRPSILRYFFALCGQAMGCSSRILGMKRVLKTDIWVEKEAIKHYNKLIGTIDWDPDTRKVLEKNRADEQEHVKRWEKLLSV
ncbi:MAG: Uncharacterized protein XE00_0339 [Desulfofundulus kuznetsovii]|nr:MAG: Uncharacterized protein XD84_0772 [Desulfotomaculum sp. 46_80]KUK84988.1 MAG: Uncharacterized protein XE00_0339 [Desulfofundulus kuznetsovii]